MQMTYEDEPKLELDKWCPRNPQRVAEVLDIERVWQFMIGLIVMRKLLCGGPGNTV